MGVNQHIAVTTNIPLQAPLISWHGAVEALDNPSKAADTKNPKNFDADGSVFDNL
ncbi:MAG: hypothetical protein ACI814_004904 [Mariniblastus sp.]|jgi:hypothetical protein